MTSGANAPTDSTLKIKWFATRLSSTYSLQSPVRIHSRHIVHSRGLAATAVGTRRTSSISNTSIGHIFCGGQITNRLMVAYKFLRRVLWWTEICSVTFSSAARSPVTGFKNLTSVCNQDTHQLLEMKLIRLPALPGSNRYDAVATGLNFVWSFPNPLMQCASTWMAWPAGESTCISCYIYPCCRICI